MNRGGFLLSAVCTHHDPPARHRLFRDLWDSRAGWARRRTAQRSRHSRYPYVNRGDCLLSAVCHSTIQPRIPRFRGPPTRSHFVGAIRCAPHPSVKNCRTLPKAALLGSLLNDAVRWHLPSVPLNGCFATALMKVDSAEPTFGKNM